MRKKSLVVLLGVCLTVMAFTGCGEEEKPKDTHVADVVAQVEQQEVKPTMPDKWADMIGDEVRVRDSHSLNSSVVGHLYRTQKVKVLEQFKSTSGRTWCKVKVQDSDLIGWVAGEYVSLDGKTLGDAPK